MAIFSPYLDLLKPDYNILNKAGSLYGFKHTEESKIFEHLKRINSSAEHQAKRLAALKISNSSIEHQELLKRLHLSRIGCARPEGSGIPSVQVEVFDSLNDKTTAYLSISEAARAIGANKSSISSAFKRLREGESTI